MVNIQEFIGYAIAAMTLGVIFVFIVLMVKVDEDLYKPGEETASQVVERVTITSVPVQLRFKPIVNSSFSLINLSTDALNDTIPTTDYQIDDGCGCITAINSTDWGPTAYANYTNVVQGFNFNISRSVHEGSGDFGTVTGGAGAALALAVIAMILFGLFIKFRG